MRLSSKMPRERIRCFRQVRAVWIWLLLWISIAGPTGARAQGNDIMDLSPGALKNVQIYSASMYLQSDREAPSSMTVITAEQIRQFGYRTLADALSSVRGFDVTYDRNSSYLGVRLQNSLSLV